jgi:hypothetical protein
MDLSAAAPGITAQQFTNPSTGIPASTIGLGQMMRPQIVGGKVAVPVQDYSVFTRYKHISVTPAPSDGPGYSSSRLRILDTLIDRLIQMKERSIEREQNSDVSGMSSEAIDALIQQYAGKYKALNEKGVEGLSEKAGVDFGHKESGNALLLDMLV